MEILPERLKTKFALQVQEMTEIAQHELHEDAPSAENLRKAYEIWLEEAIAALIDEAMPRVCGRNRDEFNGYAFKQALLHVEGRA